MSSYGPYSKTPVAIPQLVTEIQSSDIVPELDGITYYDKPVDNLTVTFFNDLSPSEQTTLATVISDHVALTMHDYRIWCDNCDTWYDVIAAVCPTVCPECGGPAVNITGLKFSPIGYGVGLNADSILVDDNTGAMLSDDNQGNVLVNG